MLHRRLILWGFGAAPCRAWLPLDGVANQRVRSSEAARGGACAMIGRRPIGSRGDQSACQWLRAWARCSGRWSTVACQPALSALLARVGMRATWRGLIMCVQIGARRRAALCRCLEPLAEVAPCEAPLALGGSVVAPTMAHCLGILASARDRARRPVAEQLPFGSRCSCW